MAIGKDVDPTQWLELFQSLSHVSNVHIGEKELVSCIVHALVSEDAGYTAAGLLPGLALLYPERVIINLLLPRTKLPSLSGFLQGCPSRYILVRLRRALEFRSSI